MKLFKDLVFTELGKPYNGKQSRMQFDNGYGISVISHNFSYGGRVGLYEIAVLDNKGGLNFDTIITNDVIGFLTESDVSRIMKEIQQLPAINN